MCYSSHFASNIGDVKGIYIAREHKFMLLKNQL